MIQPTRSRYRSALIDFCSVLSAKCICFQVKFTLAHNAGLKTWGRSHLGHISEDICGYMCVCLCVSVCACVRACMHTAVCVFFKITHEKALEKRYDITEFHRMFVWQTPSEGRD